MNFLNYLSIMHVTFPVKTKLVLIDFFVIILDKNACIRSTPLSYFQLGAGRAFDRVVTACWVTSSTQWAYSWVCVNAPL